MRHIVSIADTKGKPVDFKEIVHTEGDCFARYMVRMEEILESMDIIEQLIDNIPEGNYQEKMKPIIRVPEGNYYAAVEGSRGEFGVYLESRGDKFPYRMKFRATGLPLVSAITAYANMIHTPITIHSMSTASSSGINDVSSECTHWVTILKSNII